MFQIGYPQYVSLPFGGTMEVTFLPFTEINDPGKWEERMFQYSPSYTDTIHVGPDGSVWEKFNHKGMGLLYNSWDEFETLHKANFKILRNFEEGTHHGFFFQLNPEESKKILESISFKEYPTKEDDSHRLFLLDDGRVFWLSKGRRWGELFENVDSYKYYVENYLRNGDFIVPIPFPEE